MSSSDAGSPGVPSEITFRNCTSEDIPALFEFWPASGSLPTATDSPEALRTKLNRDPELFVLAFEGELLIGCVMGGWDGWRAYLYRLAVLPSHRRFGIASRLVRMVEDRLHELGAIRIYALAVRPEIEPAATEFWSSMGYELNPRLLPYVKTLG